MKKVRVWDLPVRLFHWILAGLIIAAVVTENIGGNAMIWHFRIGYAVLTLLGFRLLWGVVGPRYARFSSFLYSPSALIAYLRNPSAFRLPGHSPLGALSVFALLLVLLGQAASGLFTTDDIAFDGPMVKFASEEWVSRLTWYHTEVSAYLVYFFVGLHMAAIAFYALRGRNLVAPMITGDAASSEAVPSTDDSWGKRLLALVLLAACAAAVYYLVTIPAPSF
jgi:cytochrome b